MSTLLVSVTPIARHWPHPLLALSRGMPKGKFQAVNSSVVPSDCSGTRTNGSTLRGAHAESPVAEKLSRHESCGFAQARNRRADFRGLHLRSALNARPNGLAGLRSGRGHGNPTGYERNKGDTSNERSMGTFLKTVDKKSTRALKKMEDYSNLT